MPHLQSVKFSEANAKIEALKDHPVISQWLTNGRKVYSFDLLSGYSCPFAKNCLAKAVQIGGKRKIQDGPDMEFRCFSASQEVQYTNTYNLRKRNFDAIRQCDTSDEMAKEINHVLPKKAGVIRIHVAGDFFNFKYFLAWCKVARMNPGVLFYAYTKSLKFWTQADAKNLIPDNLVLTASRGGRLDDLIELENLRETIVVHSEEEAANLGLEIDHDDSHAANPENRQNNFALLIHGTQAKGSAAAEALKILKRNKVRHSYSRKAASV